MEKRPKVCTMENSSSRDTGDLEGQVSPAKVANRLRATGACHSAQTSMHGQRARSMLPLTGRHMPTLRTLGKSSC